MAKLICCKTVPPLYKEEMVTEIDEKVFIIDGYSVGERITEGIIFTVHFDDDEVTKVEVENKDSKKYLEDNLNSKVWYKKVIDYANEILSEGDEVDVPYYIKKKYFKNGINVAYITP